MTKVVIRRVKWSTMAVVYRLIYEKKVNVVLRVRHVVVIQMSDVLAIDKKWLTLVDDDRLSTTEVDDDASDSDDGDELKVKLDGVKLDGSTKEDELEGTDGSISTHSDGSPRTLGCVG